MSDASKAANHERQLTDSWQRNFLRPRHPKVLRETPMGRWWHKERRLTREGKKRKHERSSAT